MRSFSLEPLSGIRGSIRFGMKREEVRRTLAPAIPRPFSRGTTEVDGFYDSSVQVSYGKMDEVTFLEFARNRENQVLLDGFDLMGSPAASVINYLKSRFEVIDDEMEPGYSFRLPTMEIGLWRSVVPSTDADVEGRYFESVGFGTVGYYSTKNG